MKIESGGTIFVYLFLNLMCIYTVNCLLHAALGERKKAASLAFYIINVLYYVSLLYVFLFSGPGLSDFLISLSFLFFITLCYESTLQYKLIACVVVLVAIGGMETAILAAVHFFTGGTIDIGIDSQMFFYLVIFSKMLLLAFTKWLSPFLMCVRNQNHQMIDIPKIYWISILFIPLASMFVIYAFYLEIINHSEEPTDWISCIAISLMICITVAVFLLYDKTLEASRTKLKVAIQEQQLESYITAYQGMQKTAHIVFEERHNLKNKAISLLKCLEPGNAEAVEQTRLKLQDLIGEYKACYHHSWCDIPIIDAILNTKAAHAEKYGISFEAHVLTESFPIDEETICIVLGNALDNAIEACSQVDEGSRSISVSISEEDTNLFIMIQNPYAGTICKQNGIPQSTKGDPLRHGFGLSSIMRVVRQQHGIVDIDTSDHQFSLSILLRKNGCSLPSVTNRLP